MDRYDEKKDRTDEVEPVEPRRDGDVLGLGGTPVPKAPDDPSTEHDPASVAKRRARARGDEEPGRTRESTDHPGGATGIDMGAGGQGTNIRGE